MHNDNFAVSVLGVDIAEFEFLVFAFGSGCLLQAFGLGPQVGGEGPKWKVRMGKA